MALHISHAVVVLFCCSLTLMLRTGFGVELPPAVECKSQGRHCNIFTSQGIWEDHRKCDAAKAVWPKSEGELVHAVAQAVKRHQKIRVVSRMAHSIPKLVCPGRGGLIINTQYYASILAVDKAAMTITVQAGIMMREVMDEAAKHGFAVPAMIYWDGVSAAGVISTGAHGSGLVGKGSGVYEYVVSMKIVVPASRSQGYAKVVTLTQADEDLNAARLSLGTLGAISEITFALRPMFKRSVSAVLRDDSDLENEAERFLRAYEFADIEWVPSHRKAVFMAKYAVPVDVPGNGENALLVNGAKVLDVETGAYQYDKLQSAEDVDAICNVLESQSISTVAKGNGFLNDGINFTGYPVVGFNNRMQSFGGCQGNGSDNLEYAKTLGKNDTICPWDRRVHTIMYFDVETRVPMSNLVDALKDIKKLRDLNPQKLCDTGDILIRSVKKTEAYLGPAEDMVAIELRSYRPREANTPQWNGEVFQEMEQMLVEKHGGGLHWGKSGGYLFEGIAKRVVDLEKFLKVKERFDPHGLFSNEWTNGLFGRGVEELTEGCALIKLCKCRVDEHCAPHKGYFCKPGRIWKNARVCRKMN